MVHTAAGAVVAAASAPLLQAVGLTKAFGAITAVDDVSIEVRAGEVLGLVGENGAGKSTLISMLAGSVTPDSGRIVIDGVEKAALTPAAARRLGVAVVYQELSLCPNLTVAENIFLGEPAVRLGVLQRRTMRTETTRLMAELGAAVDPDVRVDRLRMAERQLIELARALRGQVRVLVLDEPTSSLSVEDFQVLESIIRRLQDAKVGVIFVSHRLSEVIHLADRITVMRDGRVVTTVPGYGATNEQLAGLMVGRREGATRQRAISKRLQPAGANEVALELRHASARGKFDDISIRVLVGEIVGIAGLRGAGRHELADAVFGLEPLDSGDISIRGRRIRRMSTLAARRLGISYLPQDRRGHGIVAVWDLNRNLALGNLSIATRWGLIEGRRLRAWSRGVLQRFQVTPPVPEAPILSLSGGNQQKVVLGRSLARTPSLLIALEPTRGVDVGAKEEIRQLILEAAKGGAAVLLVDSELADMLSLCDRMYVMHRGRLVGHLDRDEATEEAVTLLAAGGSEINAAGEAMSEGGYR